jgi:small multidrug resistance pump
MAWVFLGAAIACELCATLCLKVAATGRPRLYSVVAIGYVTSFVMLSLCLEGGFPLGVAYGTWVATGVALTAVVSRAVFQEPLTPTMLGGIALVVAGVLMVEIGAGH